MDVCILKIDSLRPLFVFNIKNMQIPIRLFMNNPFMTKLFPFLTFTQCFKKRLFQSLGLEYFLKNKTCLNTMIKRFFRRFKVGFKKHVIMHEYAVCILTPQLQVVNTSLEYQDGRIRNKKNTKSHSGITQTCSNEQRVCYYYTKYLDIFIIRTLLDICRMQELFSENNLT